jgi:hypothetical protein
MKKNYVFKKETALDHYHADAFVVRCFDNRYWKVFKNFLRDTGIKHIDPESVAGGAKIFASPEKESDRDFMARELEKSIRLHHTKNVMLFTHHDCGAYGGFAKFGHDDILEFSFHTDELKKAASHVKEKFPSLEVSGYFLDRDGVTVVELT